MAGKGREEGGLRETEGEGRGTRLGHHMNKVMKRISVPLPGHLKNSIPSARAPLKDLQLTMADNLRDAGNMLRILEYHRYES
jgi:hypothetical protein